MQRIRKVLDIGVAGENAKIRVVGPDVGRPGENIDNQDESEEKAKRRHRS